MVDVDVLIATAGRGSTRLWRARVRRVAQGKTDGGRLAAGSEASSRGRTDRRGDGGVVSRRGRTMYG